MHPHYASSPVRAPAVAGTFYPGGREELRRIVDTLLSEARPQLTPSARAPKALIAPHAGYVYSGPIAAAGYVRLTVAAERIKRVVLLGPAHRVAVRGLALPQARAFETPLGVVPLDVESQLALASIPGVERSAPAHAMEHSIEVHLPFLQRVLGSFAFVPLVVGGATPEQVCEVLEALWGGDETLIVVSSDLSHYLAYAHAQQMDRATAESILGGQPVLDHEQACGATPINGLLLAAARRGLTPQLHDLRNSGDTAGDRVRVVGYASFGFYAELEAALADELGEGLLRIARASIGRVLGIEHPAHENDLRLHQHGACFVTLMREGRLRGCVGSLAAHRTLLEDVKANARAAAFLDPRFDPLTLTELASTRIEVSLLSSAERLAHSTEDEALTALRPGEDGVILELGEQRATFLPQVWEQMDSPREFLAQLKRKAGLAADYWSSELRLWRYTVSKWRES